MILNLTHPGKTLKEIISSYLFNVQGLRVKVQGLGFGDLGFNVQGLGFRDLGLKVEGLGFRDLGFRI